MKKLLSIILTLTMILSSAVFAAPVMVNTVDTAAEEATIDAVEELYASVADETDYGTLVYDIDFEGVTNTAFTSGAIADLNKVTATPPAGFPATEKTTFRSTFATTSIENGVATVTSSASHPSFYIEGGSFPEGQYYVSFDATNLEANENTTHYLAICIEPNGKTLFYTSLGKGTSSTTKGYIDYLNGKVTYMLDGKQYTQDASSITALRFYININNSGSAATFTMDNFKVYYKPAVTVSFNNTVSSETADGVNLISGESFSLANSPVFEETGTHRHIGWSLTEGGELIADESLVISNDTTLYAVWEQYATEEDLYGTLVYDITFDTAETTFDKAVANYGSVNVPAGFPDASESILTTNFGTKSIAGGKAAVSDAGSWKRINVATPTSLPEGNYTVKYSITNPSASNHSVSAWALGDASNGHYGTSVTAGNTLEYAEQFIYQDGYLDFGPNNEQHRAASTFTGIGVTVSSSNANVKFDYIKIYYKPFVNVSFNCGDTTETISGVKLSAGDKLDISAYKLSDTADKLFCGWSDNNGNAVTGTVAITESTTFNAVWENKVDTEKGTLVYYINFNNPTTDEFGTNISNYGVVNDPETLGFPIDTTIVSTFTSNKIENGVATVSASRSWPRLNIITGSVFPDGEYTVSVDFTNNNEVAADITLSLDQTWVYGEMVGAGETNSFERSFSYSDGVFTSGSTTGAHSSLNTISLYTSIGGSEVTPARSFTYDNIRVYYKAPVIVSVSFDGAGVTDETIAPVQVTEGSSIDLTQYSFPNVENYIFAGWKDKDGNKLSGTVTVEEDMTLTAVWTYTGVAPLSYAENSIRTNDPQGIRFKSAVTNTVKADAKTTEYGFIVTLERHLGERSADYLTFEQEDVAYVSGVNYGYDPELKRDVDRIFAKDVNLTYFTAAIYGITPSKANYEEQIIARSYIKYDGKTIYGEPMSRSVLDVAKALRDKDYEGLDAAGKQVIEDILEICGEEI